MIKLMYCWIVYSIIEYIAQKHACDVRNNINRNNNHE